MASQLPDHPKSNLTSLKKRQLKNPRYNNKKKLLLENNNINNDKIINEDTTDSIGKKQSYKEIKNAKRRAETAAKPKCQGIKKDKTKCEKGAKENGFCEKHQPKLIPIDTFCEGYIPEKVIVNGEQPYIPKKCDAKTKNNNKYCGKHINFFGSLSLEEIEKIKNGNAKVCSKTIHWHFGELAICDKCSISNTDYRNNHKMTPKEIAAKKCKWVDNNDIRCGRYAINDTDCCECHDYAIEYTPEMIKNVSNCSGCNKLKYLGDYKTCDYCRNAGKKARTKHEENKIICKGTIKNEPCPFEANENGYCGNHQKQFWKQTIEDDHTKKVCTEYIRGCKNVLDIDSEYGRCDDCREKGRNKDKIKRLINKTENKPILIDRKENVNYIEFTHEDIKNILNDIIDVEEENYDDESIDIEEANPNDEMIAVKKCGECKKYYTTDNFRTLRGNISEKCTNCLGNQRIRDRKRDRKGRDYKTYEQGAERKEKKKQWRLDNPEKSQQYTEKSRGIRIRREGIDEYHRKNNEYTNNHRKQNPEKQKIINSLNKVNIKYRYGWYKREAENKGRQYELTFEQSKEYFLGDCYYCGNSPCEKILLNGIDRKHNYGDYTFDNCVSACELCNMIKGEIVNDIEFLKICEHILTNLKIIAGNKNIDSFEDCISGDYLKYYNSSNKRHLEFDINGNDFENITTLNCYLCNKQNSMYHRNGIDRIHNNYGYNLLNCKSCCKQCNRMKNSYNLYEILKKLISICTYHNLINQPIDNFAFDGIYLNLVKPYSPEELKFNMSSYCNNNFGIAINKTNIDSDDDNYISDEYVSDDISNYDNKSHSTNDYISDDSEDNIFNENENDTELKPLGKYYETARKQIYRETKRMEMGDDEYKKFNAENMKIYRDNKNPNPNNYQKPNIDNKQYERERKQKYRLNLNKPIRKKLTKEEKREKERVRKKIQRNKTALKYNVDE